jgi:aminoglycoside phosphotransferase (APT) family kinase protein
MQTSRSEDALESTTTAVGVAGALTQELAQVCSALGHEKGDLMLRAPSFTGRNSVIYKVETDGPGRVYAIKHFRTVDQAVNARELAARQFTGMRKAYDIAGPHGGHLVPKPYAILDRSAAIVVEWVAGSNLLELLRQGWALPRAYTELIANAGKWLRAVHDAGAPTETELPAEILLLDAEAALARCVPASVARRASRALANALPAVRGNKCVETWAHGDFKPANLMVAKENGNLVGLDLQLSKRGPGVFDVASFLNDLAVNLRMPGMLRLLVGERAFEHAFLDEYWRRKTKRDVALQFVRLCSLAETWATETGPGVGKIKSAMFSRGYAGVAQHLMHELAASVRAESRGGHG